MQVGQLLDLQGRLQTGRVLVTTTHDQEGCLLAKGAGGELFEAGVHGEDLLDLSREFVQSVDDLVPSLGHRDPVLGELDGYHDQGNVLRGVGLRDWTGEVTLSSESTW